MVTLLEYGLLIFLLYLILEVFIGIFFLFSGIKKIDEGASETGVGTVHIT